MHPPAHAACTRQAQSLRARIGDDGAPLVRGRSKADVSSAPPEQSGSALARTAPPRRKGKGPSSCRCVHSPSRMTSASRWRRQRLQLMHVFQHGCGANQGTTRPPCGPSLAAGLLQECLKGPAHPTVVQQTCTQRAHFRSPQGSASLNTRTPHAPTAARHCPPRCTAL